MGKAAIFLITLSLAFNIYAKPKTSTKLSYQSFVDYARSGKVKFLTISDFSTDDMKVTVVKNGKDVEYLVEKPYKTSEDIVFLDFLKKNKVPHEIIEKKHDLGTFFWLSSFSGMIIFLSPFVLMIFLIIIMIRTKKMENLLKSQIESNDSTDSKIA